MRRSIPQSGAALVVVLLTISIMSAAAMLISEQIQYEIRRSDNRSTKEQAYWYLSGAETYAIGQLNRFITKQDTDGLTRYLSKVSNFTLDMGQLRTRQREMSGCFNLNRFLNAVPERGGSGVDSSVVTRLFTLLRTISVPDVEAKQIVQRLLDWVDPDTAPSGRYGAEDLYYTSLKRPYRTPNGPLGSVEELYKLEISAETFQKMESLVCVVPLEFDGKLNLNRVQRAEILVAETEGKLSLSVAGSLLTQRPVMGYASMEDIAELISEEELKLIDERFTLEHGRVFSIESSVKYRGSYIKLETLAAFDRGRVHILSRRYGE